MSKSKGSRNMQALVSSITRYVGPCSTSLVRELSQELLTWSLDAPTTQLSTRAVQAYMHCRARLQAKDVHTVLQLLVRKFVINSSRWAVNAKSERSPGFDLALGVLDMFQRCSAATPPTSYAIFWTSVAMMMSGVESIVGGATRALLCEALSGVEAAARDEMESFWKYCSTWSPNFNGLLPLLFKNLLRGHALEGTVTFILRFSANADVFAPKALRESSEVLRLLVPAVLALPYLFNCLHDRKQLALQSPPLAVQLRVYATGSRAAYSSLAEVLDSYLSGSFNGSPDLFIVAFGRCIVAKCSDRDAGEVAGLLTCLFQAGPQEFSASVMKLARVIVAGSDPQSKAVQALAPVLRSMARQPIWKPGSSSGKDPIVELMSRVSLDVGAPMPPVALALSTGPTSGPEEEAAVSALAGVIFGLKKDLMKEKLGEEDVARQSERGQGAAPDHPTGQVRSDDSGGGHKRTPAHPIQRLTSGAPGSTATSATDTGTKGRETTLATQAATGDGPKVVWRARRIGRTANGKRIWVSDSEASGTSSESEDDSDSGSSHVSEDSESGAESYSGDSYSSDSYSYSDSGSYSGSYSSGEE